MFVIIGYKKGLILTVLNMAAIVGAMAVAFICSGMATQWLYSTFIEGTISDALNSVFTTGVLSAESISEDIQSVFSFLPDGIFNVLVSSGIFDAENFDLSGVVDVETLLSETIGPFVVKIIGGVVFIALIIICIIIFKMIVRFIAKHLTPKPIKKISAVLGGVLGMVHGVLVVMILANILFAVSYCSEGLRSSIGASYIVTFAENYASVFSLY